VSRERAPVLRSLLAILLWAIRSIVREMHRFATLFGMRPQRGLAPAPHGEERVSNHEVPCSLERWSGLAIRPGWVAGEDGGGAWRVRCPTDWLFDM
jgi:hypothetical protein